MGERGILDPIWFYFSGFSRPLTRFLSQDNIFPPFRFHCVGQVSKKSPAVFAGIQRPEPERRQFQLGIRRLLFEDWHFFFKRWMDNFGVTAESLFPTMQARTEQITHCLCKAGDFFLKATDREGKKYGRKIVHLCRQSTSWLVNGTTNLLFP